MFVVHQVQLRHFLHVVFPGFHFPLHMLSAVAPLIGVAEASAANANPPRARLIINNDLRSIIPPYIQVSLARY